jgi:heme oxygenase
MIDPLLWQSVPFDNEEAWLDWLREHEAWHRRLGIAPMVPLDDLRVNLERHQQLHAAENALLGLGQPPDLTQYDLHDRVAYYTWMQLHAVETARQRQAAGF